VAEASQFSERTVVPAQDFRAAAERIAPYVRRTPVLRAVADGRPVAFKLEYLQAAGVFKIRGALNALLTAGNLSRVVTASGGNHGLGVATAARWLGVPATVFVPATVPEVKARRIAEQGTLGLEILADMPECDAVAVPVGGGGLLAGVSGAIAPCRAVAAMSRAKRRQRRLGPRLAP
jgi:threonine dehydratase